MTANIAPEIRAISDFLAICPPFDLLDRRQLICCASRISISYHRRGERIDSSSANSVIRIVKAGALDLLSGDTLLDRLGERESVNLPNLLKENRQIYIEANEDSLLYQIDNSLIQKLRDKNRDFDRFFHRQRARRLRRAARFTPNTPKLMRPIMDFASHSVVSCEALTSSAEAAVLMTEHNVSSILVIEDSVLIGILTDRDLRRRLVAKQLPYDTPVSALMTDNPEDITQNATLFDAMLLMSERNIHHLPIVEQGKPVGIVSASDVVKNRENDPVYLIQRISQQTTVEGLASVAKEIPELLKALVPQGAIAAQIAQIVSTVADHIGVRLLQLAEQQLGNAPAPYCWLLFGSQARQEMVLGGDQDNALVIEDSATEQDMDYFASLAAFVCDGLNDCGFDYCRGNIMASNTEWRLRLGDWCKTVSQWVRSPTEDAVMRVSIFFDLRALHGTQTLAHELQSHMLKSASTNSIFLAMLARNAVSNTPPLGFFRRFVLEKNGDHKNTLDLKHRGIIPIVDFARVESLRYNMRDVNTHARIECLSKMGRIALKDARNLIDAIDLLLQIRIKNQYQQLRDGEQTDNFVAPDSLSDIECKHLKDAFSVISDAQHAIANRYTQGVV